jgi:GNAT superfamily N-acetyltransferase
VILRPPTEDDAEAIAALLNAYAPEPVTGERIRRSWGAPGVDLDRDARVVVADGELTGFAAVKVEDGHTWIELHGSSLGEVIDWATERARGRVYTGGWQANEEVRTALLRKGFTLARHSYRMAIDLGEVPPEPRWPDGVTVRGFRAGEGPAVYEAHMETFEDSWEHVRQPYDQWSHWMLDRPGFDPNLWLLATVGDQIAGIALCRLDETDPRTGWVSIFGVRRPWRRQGLGRALLLESFRRLAAHGCARAILGVDASSLTGAHELYENAGMRVISTFDIYELPA